MDSATGDAPGEYTPDSHMVCLILKLSPFCYMISDNDTFRGDCELSAEDM